MGKVVRVPRGRISGGCEQGVVLCVGCSRKREHHPIAACLWGTVSPAWGWGRRVGRARGGVAGAGFSGARLWLLSCKLLNDENYAGSRCSVKGFLPDQVHVLYKMFRNMRSNLTSLKEKSDFPDGAWVASGRQIRFLLNEDFKCGTPRRGRDSGPFWGQQ